MTPEEKKQINAIQEQVAKENGYDYWSSLIQKNHRFNSALVDKAWLEVCHRYKQAGEAEDTFASTMKHHGEKCIICHEKVDSWGGNPFNWQLDIVKLNKPLHYGCVIKAIESAIATPPSIVADSAGEKKSSSVFLRALKLHMAEISGTICGTLDVFEFDNTADVIEKSEVIKTMTELKEYSDAVKKLIVDNSTSKAESVSEGEKSAEQKSKPTSQSIVESQTGDLITYFNNEEGDYTVVYDLGSEDETIICFRKKEKDAKATCKILNDILNLQKSRLTSSTQAPDNSQLIERMQGLLSWLKFNTVGNQRYIHTINDCITALSGKVDTPSAEKKKDHWNPY